MNNRFWIYEPLILFDKKEIKNIWPSKYMTQNEKLNSITRLVILLTILGYLATHSINIVLSGILTLIIIIIYNKKNEGFVGESNLWNKIESEPELVKNETLTQPTTNNPLMNVMIPEITENPSRGSAELSTNENIHNEINSKAKELIIENSNLDEKLFKDAGDEMDFEHSMRNFYTNPNTTIPNSQTEFAEWCYGDMISRKETTSLEQN